MYKDIVNDNQGLFNKLIFKVTTYKKILGYLLIIWSMICLVFIVTITTGLVQFENKQLETISNLCFYGLIFLFDFFLAFYFADKWRGDKLLDKFIDDPETKAEIIKVWERGYDKMQLGKYFKSYKIFKDDMWGIIREYEAKIGKQVITQYYKKWKYKFALAIICIVLIPPISILIWSFFTVLN